MLYGQATSSQAKLEEQKKMMQAFKKEEDLKVQLQLLSASLAQKDENIDTLSRERSQKEVSAHSCCIQSSQMFSSYSTIEMNT